MLLIIGVVTVFGVALAIAKVRVPGGVEEGKLGSVSEQWLLEHRASHPS